MRIVISFASLALSACGGSEQQTSATAAAAPNDRIECALAGAERFTADCAIERSDETLTIRHPDGGFRRLLVTGDGRGVIAADGAAPAQVAVIADRRIEVTLDRDRYRLPATIKGQ
jgi:hypothetical protein